MAASVNVSLPEPFGYCGLSVQIKILKITAIDGSLKTQVSNDGLTWFDYEKGNFATTAITDDVNLLLFVDDKMLPFKFMRLSYTRTSGSGTMSVSVAGIRA